MLASTIRDDDQISLVSSGSSEGSHRGQRIPSPAVFTSCLPSLGGHHRSVISRAAGRSKVPNKQHTLCWTGREAQSAESAQCASKPEMSPSRICRTGTLATSITEPHLSDFGSKVPMDFSHTTGKIIDDPEEVIAMFKEEQWRTKDQVRFHSPDNRLPYLSSYLIQPWFHGEMSRDDAVSMIGANGGKEGTFLIRLSRSLPGCFVLSMSHAGGVLHYPITQVKDPSGEKLLSLDSGRTKFMDLIQLVEFYQVNVGNYLPTTLRHFVTRAVDVPRSSNSAATPRSSF